MGWNAGKITTFGKQLDTIQRMIWSKPSTFNMKQWASHYNNSRTGSLANYSITKNTYDHNWGLRESDSMGGVSFSALYTERFLDQ
jgi:hypothetical protein